MFEEFVHVGYVLNFPKKRYRPVAPGFVLITEIPADDEAEHSAETSNQ